MEYSLLKLVALIFTFTVILPIVKVYIQAKVKYQKKVVKQDTESFSQLKAIRDIYEKERKQYYLEARDLFNSLCKQGKIHSTDVKLIKVLLLESLGGYAEEYKNCKYQNPYHEIYSMMKSLHIDVWQWKRIIEHLNSIDSEEKAIR